MKKTLLTLAIIATAASSVFAQGFVLFNNTSAAGTKISTNDFGSVGLTTGTTSGSFYYALFYSATATSVNGSSAAVAGTGSYVWGDSNWHFSSVYGTSTTAGRFVSDSADANNSGGTAVAGVALGGTAQFVVVGWSSSIGSTIAALEAWYANPTGAGLIGESIVSGPIVTSSGGSSPEPALFGTQVGSISGFTLSSLTTVPEPTTVALIGIGGLGLAMIRRRK